MHDTLETTKTFNYYPCFPLAAPIHSLSLKLVQKKDKINSKIDCTNTQRTLKKIRSSRIFRQLVFELQRVLLQNALCAEYLFFHWKLKLTLAGVENFPLANFLQICNNKCAFKCFFCLS